MRGIVTMIAAALMLGGCSQSGNWTKQQKEEVRASVSESREKFVLQYMQERDFAALQACVLESLTGIFTEYEEYSTLDDRTETLDGIMSDCAVDAMGGNYENLDAVFPVEALQQAGWIPAGASLPEGMFYERLAGKIRGNYPNPDAFVMALMLDPNAQDNLRQMIVQSAAGQ